jgi:hypothetical protein
MSHYSLGRGRKKEVEKFTSKQGLYLLSLLMLCCIFFLLLIILGVLHVHGD